MSTNSENVAGKLHLIYKTEAIIGAILDTPNDKKLRLLDLLDCQTKRLSLI